LRLTFYALLYTNSRTAQLPFDYTESKAVHDVTLRREFQQGRRYDGEQKPGDHKPELDALGKDTEPGKVLTSPE
jgi:hypothetical protein